MSANRTVQDLVTETRRYLTDNRNEERNRLQIPYTAGTTTLQFAFDAKGIAAGARLSIGLNTFYVWAVDAPSKMATVTGGEDGSVDADADAGDMVRVRPRYTDSDILRALNDDLDDLSSPGNGLYQMVTHTFSPTSSYNGYDLPAVGGILDIYSVRSTLRGNSRSQARVSPTDYRLERNQDDPLFPSGNRFELLQGGVNGEPVTVSYRTGFTTFTGLSQLATESGLPATATDLPPMGAALALVAGKEIRRNQLETQGDTRRADEVPAGAEFGSMRGLTARRSDRIMAEAWRLQAAYPVLM